MVYHRLRSSSEKKMNKLKINQQCHLVMKKSHHNMMGCTPDKPYEGILPFCLAQVTLHPAWGTAHQERWKIKVKLQEWLEVKKNKFFSSQFKSKPRRGSNGLNLQQKRFRLQVRIVHITCTCHKGHFSKMIKHWNEPP